MTAGRSCSAQRRHSIHIHPNAHHGVIDLGSSLPSSILPLGSCLLWQQNSHGALFCRRHKSPSSWALSPFPDRLQLAVLARFKSQHLLSTEVVTKICRFSIHLINFWKLVDKNRVGNLLFLVYNTIAL